MSKKALIAMSGGVDSAVSALLTKEKGYECIGCNMRLFDKDGDDADFDGYKSADARDAALIADRIGIDFVYKDFRSVFESTVMSDFAEKYFLGQTPNPCVVCNKCLKFGELFRTAEELGCDTIVTGHYAKVEELNGEYFLRKAADTTKDQSYVLYQLTQKQLAHIYFPLGDYTKLLAREIAAANGFVNAEKKDSQDICFVPDGEYVSIVRSIAGKDSAPGNFVLKDGTVLGSHKGIINYTIGQRKGLGIAYEHPLYVCEIRPETNTVVLSDNEALFSKGAVLKDVNWISGKIPTVPVECKVKIRYKALEVDAVVYPAENGGATIQFKNPQRAVTAGQSAVFYSGDYVLGGGTIIAASE